MAMAIATLSSNAKPVSMADAAEICGLSRRYLDQLGPPLKNAGLLRARAGRGGGYALAKPPEQIRVREIVEAAIGPIAIADCANGSSDCTDPEACRARDLWRLVNRRICSYLEEFTLADLVDDDWPARAATELASLDGLTGEDRPSIGGSSE
jgi:Rrf2 family protein